MAHTGLDLRERRAIEDVLNAKMSALDVAAAIARHRWAVYRDIKRSRFVDEELPKLNGYHGMIAQHTAMLSRRHGGRQAARRDMVWSPLLPDI